MTTTVEKFSLKKRDVVPSIDLRRDMADHAMIQEVCVWHSAGKPLRVASVFFKPDSTPQLTYVDADSKPDPVAHHQADAKVLIPHFVDVIANMKKNDYSRIFRMLVTYVDFLPQAGIEAAPIIFLNVLSAAVLQETNQASHSGVLKFGAQIMPSQQAIQEGYSFHNLLLGIHHAVGGDAKSMYRFSITYRRQHIQV